MNASQAPGPEILKLRKTLLAQNPPTKHALQVNTPRLSSSGQASPVIHLRIHNTYNPNNASYQSSTLSYAQ